jgi:DNA invertase Pin-like site-specific DNA recombinase/transposase
MARKKLRVAIYARFSSRFQHSIEDQVRVCREWAERNEMEVVEVFVDEAVTGKSSRRQGLHQLRDALEADRIDVVVVFTTNRLYRKMYQSLAFVEEEIVDRGKRCVFVHSGIDSADTDDWRQRLQLHALIDEFLVQTIGKHVHAAHEGLLLQCRVFGTVTFGYTGKVIEGQTTRLGRPARRLAIDATQAEWVCRIFDLFGNQKLSIRKIVQRLNEEQAPLPPRSQNCRWTRLAVRRLLSNSRYVGDWSYGITKAVWLNRQGYLRQIERDEPIRTVQIEELRIIDPVLWAKCQERLTRLTENAGRPPKDGNRVSRPRILNGLLFCQKHNQRLYVGGSHGHYMFCKSCQEEPEPYLYSMLRRELALKLLCQRVSELIEDDERLVMEIVTAAQKVVDDCQRPDPDRLKALQRRTEQLNRHIQFILDAPGDSDEDLAENQKRLATLRAERATVLRETAEVERQLNAPAVTPSAQEVRQKLTELSSLLVGVGLSSSPEDQAAMSSVVGTLTGGRIAVSQCGERKPHQGWLRLSVEVDVMRHVLSELGLKTAPSATALIIDVRDDELADPDEVEARRLYDQGESIKDIAAALDWNRNKVTQVLNSQFEREGLELPDGRTRRWERDPDSNCQYVRIAKTAWTAWNSGESLSAIGRAHGVSDATAKLAIEHWCHTHGLPRPDVASRRKQQAEQAIEWITAGVSLKAVAQRTGKSVPTIRKWLDEWYSSRGEQRPDLRRHKKSQ